MAYQPYQQEVASSYAPTTYAASPEPGLLFDKALDATFLPGVFGWDRGSDHFAKWLKRPITSNNRVSWRTHGQRMSNGFNSASGADPNKKTDKYSYPGSYQG